MGHSKIYRLFEIIDSQEFLFDLEIEYVLFKLI